jgi:TolB-like protein/DNA-binding winged helix-turn-helix (wHTH) protein/Flp pilus assembly protein TadD
MHFIFDNSRLHWYSHLFLFLYFAGGSMNSLPSQRVRFGAFELDLRTGELRSTEGPDPNHKVLLREQLFQVLRMLVECDGKIVTREEIRSRLWGNDTVVDFDQGINSTIKALRRALGDSVDDPRYIETLGRRGYRLMLTIEYARPTTGTVLEKDRKNSEQSAAEISGNRAKVEPQVKFPWWKAAIGLGFAIIVVGGGYISSRHFRIVTLPKSGRIMLAVLPFQNLTGDPNKEYLADGLTEETISQLSRLNPERLGVISRTSVMGYKHKDTRLDQIGHDLSVQYVLENSLRESGNHYRLTSQLIQVKDQTHLWSHDYNYAAADVLNVEDEVAKEVAREIELRLTSQQRAELSRPRPVNSEAFDAYLRGYYFFQRDTDKDTDMAARYFERATQLDPSYALAWVWLSRALHWQAEEGLIPAEKGHRLAREAIERALALEPNLPEAYSQMARLKKYVDFDWAGADESIRRAIALDPGNPEYLDQAATSALTFGRSDEALALARRAVGLDPLNASSWHRRGEIEFYEGQLAGAEADVKKSLELSPDVFLGPVLLSKIYLMQGRPQDALSEIERVRSDAVRTYLYAITYAVMGRKKQSEAALKELIAKYSTREAFLVAEVYAFRNQRDEAFVWLDRAYAQHEDDLPMTNLLPELKNLHSDPRYNAFLEKIHLPVI